MNKAEFNAKVNELLRKAENIPFDDYYAGKRVVEEFESFAHDAAHVKHINQYTTEHLYAIQADLENMRKYKSSGTKTQHYQSVMNGLKQDIKSMLRNTFPE